MQTMVINVPDKKVALVKQLLKELGANITTTKKARKVNVPNALTIKTIEDARNGIGLNGPIKNISEFIESI